MYGAVGCFFGFETDAYIAGMIGGVRAVFVEDGGSWHFVKACKLPACSHILVLVFLNLSFLSEACKQKANIGAEMGKKNMQNNLNSSDRLY